MTFWRKKTRRALSVLLALSLMLSLCAPALATEATPRPVATIALAEGETGLSAHGLTVVVDSAFPRVIRYELDGKVIYGQEAKLNQLKINGALYTPNVTSEAAADSILYTLSVSELKVTLKVCFRVVAGGILEMNVTEINDTAEGAAPVKKLEFYNQKLISVKETQPGAAMAYNANYLGGDVFSTVAAKAVQAAQKNGHVILNTGELAASIEVGVSCQNVYVETAGTAGSKITSAWPYEYLYRGPDGMSMELPWAKVVITGDRNGDNVIDWQDGAVAYRDIQDDMPGDVSLAQESIFVNIPLNYRGRLPWTWENMLDMLKRQAMATDNFPQVVLIKNIEDVNMIPGFGNANQRLGGVEKFNQFVDAAKEYNIHVGGHVDTNLSYPNSPLNGGTPLNTSYGAAWDQLNREGKSIDTTKYWSAGTQGEGDDVGTYGRYGLLGERYDLQRQTYPGLDFLYVDVELGKSSGVLGADAKWHAYNVVQKFKENNWNLYTEYMTGSLGNTSNDSYRDSIATKYISWTHVWPGSGSSIIRRFIMNSETVLGTGNADYQHVLGRIPPSGDNADAMTHGYMGWVDNGRPTTLTQCLDEFWSIYLPVTYLKNFEVLKVGADPENGNRMSAWFTNGIHTYYEAPFMYMEKDGKLIAKVDSNSVPANVVKAANEIFLPWDAKTEDKIYTKLVKGGEKTWALPDSWAGLSSAVLYRLDQSDGRTLEAELPVVDGQVTISYAVGEGYVLTKGREAPIDPKWGEGSAIQDFEFNSGSFHAWEPFGYAVTTIKEDASTLNRYLSIEGPEAGGVRQTLAGLTPGAEYAITVLARSEGNKKAALSVTAGESTSTSDISYAVQVETDRKNEAWPMLRVYFTAPESGEAILSLTGEASEIGAVSFDDLRLNLEENPYGKDGYYFFDDVNDSHWLGAFMHQSFDSNVAVSYYNDLDVHGNSRGANKAYSIDTIGKTPGERSIRLMGCNGRNSGAQTGIIIKTLPSLLKFEPNSSYSLSFDYMPLYSTGAAWGATLLTAENGTEFKSDTLNAAQNAVNTYTVSFNTGSAGDVALAIKHLQSVKTQNLVIDNLKVTEIPYDPSLPTAAAPEAGEENIALNKPVTASNTGPGFTTASITDGNRNNVWSAGGRRLTDWCQIDLGAVYDLTKTVVVFEKEGQSAGCTYRMEISSDNKNWTTIYTDSDTTNQNRGREVTFEAGTAVGRYVKIYFTGLITAYPLMSAHCSEFEAYGNPIATEEEPVEGVNLALNKPASASKVEGSLDVRKAANANDGNPATLWGSGGGTSTAEWWMVDLGAVYELDKTVVMFEKAGESNGWAYDLYTSLDGSSWSKVYTSPDESANPNNIRTVTHAPGAAVGRYIRVNITHLSSLSKWSQMSAHMMEFEAYGHPYRGANIAHGKGVTVDGTSVAALTDGNLTEAWTADTAGDKSLVLDLSSDTNLTGITLIYPDAAPHRFKVEVGDGETWRTVSDKSENTEVRARNYIPFKTRAGQVRVTLLAEGETPVSLCELRVHGAAVLAKDALKAAIDHARAIDLSIYTKHTADGLRFAIQGALESLNLGTTQTVLEQAVAALTAAEEALALPQLVVNGGETSGAYQAGSSVTVTATPEQGMRFKSWTAVGVTLADNKTAQETFTMPANDVTLTANVEPLPPLETLRPELVPGDGILTLSPMVGEEGDTFCYKTTDVTDAENKPLYGDSDLTDWTAFDEAVELPGENGVTMFVQVIKVTEAGIVSWGESSAAPIRPEPDTYFVAVVNGTLEGGENIGSFAENATISIIADAPADGMKFAGWVTESEGVVFVDATAKTTTFAMPAGTVTVTAAFEPEQGPELYAATVEHGTGSGNYQAGETVAITADAPEAGMRFAGWLCEDENVVLADPMNPETTFAMPARPVTVTASFEVIPTLTLQESAILYLGGVSTAQLKAVIAPEKAETLSMIWTSDNEQVVTVSESGLITAVAKGGAVITVTVNTEKDTLTGRCVVVVTDYVAPPPSGGGSSNPTYLLSATTTEGGKISPASALVPSGGSRTFQMQADKGYVLTDLLVDGESVSFVTEKNGWSYTLSNVHKAYSIQAVFASEHEVTEPDVPLADLPFTDVVDHWAGNAIAYVASKGLMTGTGATTFDPNGTTTRATVVTILYRLAGSPKVTKPAPFSDVAADNWYADAVTWAAEKGISTGKGNGRFDPDASITRQELAVFLCGYAAQAGLKTESDGMALNEFADAAQIASWAADAMSWCVKSGILSGKSGSLLDSEGTASRAEAAVMLQRFAVYINK